MVLSALDDEKQEWFFAEHLKIAKRYALPMSVHIRRSGSRLLKYLNRIGTVGGVIHAFNGSQDEFDRFAKLGFHFGFGGAATYEGSQRIRRHLGGSPAIVGYLKQMHLISLQATDEILGICVQNQPILSQRTRLLQSYGT